MDTRLLQYYERELRLLRELGGPFARHFPKIAGRLSPDELAQADPYVERLLEGFAFMAARVQLKIDSEFPRFTQQLMELVYPHYLPPTPSMGIVQFSPDLHASRLAEGVTIPRDTVLSAQTPLRDVTACEYRTAHDVQLWPIEIESAEYTGNVSDVAVLAQRASAPVKAVLRVRLRCRGRFALRFDRLPIHKLAFFLRGGDELSAKLYEQLITSACGVWMRWGTHPERDAAVVSEPRPIRPLGFADEQALLPVSARSFQGYRLFQEYFAFPSRFDFVEIQGLTQGIARCNSDRMELIVPLSRFDLALEGAIDNARLSLFSTPAINLFPRWCGRMPMPARNHELHVVPDRTRPLDFEVHSVTHVAEHCARTGAERVFTPLNAARRGAAQSSAHYTLERRARALSQTRRQYGSRTPYIGSEVFLTLSDPSAGPEQSDRRQLAVHALCTNRDLPLLLGLGRGGNDFSWSRELPLSAARCIVGPTTPRSTPADNDSYDQAFRLISHLAPNYLSMAEPSGSADTLRGLLSLYAQLGDPILQRQLSGIRSLSATPIQRTRTATGAASGQREVMRGLEVSLSCEERAFSGHGVFTLASVLAAFFAKHAAINSFTETVLCTAERGEVYRWPMTAELRHAS
ncbi:MAG TPA: type VI secretion system baseplate subunit TssF [Polyangiales bacterium]|nr:type VI secretion system baseplate subunit TssF [Polyangiales bacterium]